jgi:hypothetical protein
MIRRGLFNIAVAVSLLLFLATLALVVVNFDRSISYVSLVPQRASVQAVFLDHYSLGLFQNHSDYVNAKAGHHHSNWFLTKLYTTGWHQGVPQIILQPADRHDVLGFTWGESHTLAIVETSKLLDDVTFEAAVPLWTPLVLFAILPVVWVGRRRSSQHRQDEGCCSACGYNFTGNTSGVCPECGMKIVPQ